MSPSIRRVLYVGVVLAVGIGSALLGFRWGLDIGGRIPWLMSQQIVRETDMENVRISARVLGAPDLDSAKRWAALHMSGSLLGLGLEAQSKDALPIQCRPGDALALMGRRTT